MRKLPILLVVGLLAIVATGAALISCDHVKGSGEVHRRNLAVADFHGIVLEGSMDVIITQSADRSVVVEAQANIAELITTEVKNGMWRIGTSKSCSTSRPFIVHISAPRMDMVHVEGSGSVSSKGTFEADEASVAIAGSGGVTMAFHARSIRSTVDGSGDVRLSGTCKQLKVAIAGSGNVLAEELRTTDLEVGIAGSGSVSADASGNVDVSIAGSGDVMLASKPGSMNERIAGSGSVRVMN